MKTIILGIIGSILIGQLSAQTLLKNIPIQGSDPYTIYVWDFYIGENPKWMSQHELREAGEYLPSSWRYHNEITVLVDPRERLDILLVSGADTCGDSTRVTIYGARSNKLKIKQGEILLNGGQYIFGPEPITPNQPEQSNQITHK